MVLVQFKILLGGSQGVFYSGQPLRGEVIVEFDSPKTLTNITLHVLGKAKVMWKVGKIFYKEKEIYFNDTITLQREEIRLPTGEHRFPFIFELPASTPSSFKNKYGRVRYTVRCVLERPGRRLHQTKREFSVVSTVDLNAQPLLALPVSNSGTKTLFCECRRSGPLSVILSLPASGAVSGQALLASCEVENLTRDRFLTTLEIVKLLVYKTPESTLKKSKSVVHKTLGTVKPGCTDSWANEAMVVPALPPSNLNFCSIIDLNYQLKLTAHPYGLHKKLEVSLPVTVGTIPFHQHFQSFRPSDEVDPPPLGWNLATPPPGSDLPPNYDDLPPPSYQQCVQDEPPQDGEEGPTFLPKYPVYMTSFG